MTQHLVAIHHPDDYDPFVAEDEAMHRDIAALNDEMKAAGVRIFVGGLQPASTARSLRAKPDGKVLITDGPYIETKEHVGGLWVLEAADPTEATEHPLMARNREAERSSTKSCERMLDPSFSPSGVILQKKPRIVAIALRQANSLTSNRTLSRCN